MKSRVLLLLLLACSSFAANAQYSVTGLFTDLNGYWHSRTDSIATKPDRSHNLLAFTWNGTTFSTGVNDAILSSRQINFVSRNFRAFPIGSVAAQTGSNRTYVGLGQQEDGVHNGAPAVSPFPVPATAAVLASFLTDGINGLDLGTGVANIAPGEMRFNLSSIGISASAINDNIPDVVVTQIAAPSTTDQDEIYFVNALGAIVGNKLTINHNSVLISGKWMADFYLPNGDIAITNSERDIRLWAADLTSFGITPANIGEAVALVYKLYGMSDVAFVAFNVPSISVATQLAVVTQPSPFVNPGCCANIPGSAILQAPVVQVRDGSGNSILQAGIPITVSVASGPAGYGALAGTTTVLTDASGRAEFSNLRLPCTEGDYVLRFSAANLDPASSDPVTVGQARFYLKESSVSTVNQLSSWSSSSDGLGSAPTDFGRGKEFLINPAVQNVYTNGNWTVTGKLSIAANKQLNITANTVTELSCDIDNLGSITGETGSTLLLNGTATQVLGGSNGLFNFRVNNSSGVHTSGSNTVSNLLTLSSGTLKLNSGSLLVGGQITVGSGIIDASAAGTTLRISSLTGVQTIPAAAVSGTVTNLVVNNTAGIIWNAETTISGSLTFTNGTLSLGTNSITVAAVAGAGSGKYVRTPSTGKLRMGINGNGISKLFPVGVNNYNPITITNRNTAADQFSVRVLPEIYREANSGEIVSNQRIRASWNIEKLNAGNTGGLNLRFAWESAQNNGVVTPVLHHFDSRWLKYTDGSSESTEPNSVQHTAYTGNAAYFAIVDNFSTLPVQWESFTAVASGNSVLLKWQTSSEESTSHFIIERSTDGLNWSALGRQQAAGNSSEVRTYTFNDANPAEGSNYYRIRQVDIDGRFSFSETRTVKIGRASGFTVLGNPIRGNTIAIRLSADDQLSLFDVSGKKLWVKKLNQGSRSIYTENLSPGIYWLRSATQSEQIIVTGK